MNEYDTGQETQKVMEIKCEVEWNEGEEETNLVFIISSDVDCADS